MRIIDRYIFRSILGIFLGCLSIFLFMYVIADLFSHLDEIFKYKVPFDILLPYYWANIPFIFVQVVPVACLLATLYTFAKLNRDNEIIAMRSSGLSILYISKTVILFGIIISILVFLVNDKIVPASLVKAKQYKIYIEGEHKKQLEKEGEVIRNLSMYGTKNRLFFVNSYSPATTAMEGIIVLEQDEEQNITKKIIADKGVYSDGLWKFYNSITYSFDKSGQVISEPRYLEEEIMPILESPEEFLNQRQSPEYMTIAQLDNYIWKLSHSGASSVVRNLKVDLYARFFAPFTSILIILLGIPFSLVLRKRATGLSSLGVSIIVAFLYYVVNAVCIALGKAGLISPPLLAVSLSHLLALAFSIGLISSIP